MKILNSYKKIAKEFIKESAWDRKFGEPLPTLEDVMNEAFNPRKADLVHAIEDMQDGQGPTGFKWVKQYAKKNKTIPDTVNHFLDKYKLRKYVYDGVSIH